MELQARAAKGEFIMIKIIITDDQDIVREGLASLLQLREELDVIATARNGQEAFEKAKELEPDIVLMDIRMPVSNGVEGTKLITSSLPGVKVLMLTTFKDSALIAEALEEGASGYLLKDMSADTIVKAVMTVHSGGMVLPPELTAQMLNEWKREKQLKGINEIEKPNELLDLTEREIEVLAELGYGLNNKEIAEKLYITEGTVKNHVSNIISKLAVRDRTQAAIYSVRYGVSVF
ncbi:two-component response regulator YfiJ [Bacillus subtilis subsp. subtilis str. SC-8]|nr:two-component response regulator YfiJ [Bacillus subtilis subsp. subtilis str. SC-8]